MTRSKPQPALGYESQEFSKDVLSHCWGGQMLPLTLNPGKVLPALVISFLVCHKRLLPASRGG